MAKLYLFGIGGTGIRVVRSLTMLFACGVKINNFAEVIPILIDPDQQLEDMQRSIPMIRAYQQLHQKSTSSFFKTKITDPFNGSFHLDLAKPTNQTFRNYMNFSTLSDEDEAMVNMLFSEANQTADMSVGFKGNPNIGSVILNQFETSPKFMELANKFVDGDVIFIISSIFGGTGASGFPALLKTLRSLPDTFPNSSIIRRSLIGAITVLPYFSLDVATDRNDTIDSTTFMSKTKAALKYYKDNMNGLNALYYVGDDNMARFDNHDGGKKQKNRAHFVELISALSILDYANNIQYLSIENPTIYKEYSIEAEEGDNPTKLFFSNLGQGSRMMLQRYMTQFILFCKYQNEQLNDSLNQLWATEGGIDNNFLTQNFYANIRQFSNGYIEWLAEMGDEKNGRAFQPFVLDCSPKNLFDLVNGVKPEKVMDLASNYALYDKYLNKKRSEANKASKEQYFLDIFDKATEKLVHDKFNF